MSINFQDDVSSEVQDKIKKLFGTPEVNDAKTFLFNKLEYLNQKLCSEIANEAKQPMAFELNDVGTIKEVAGSKYICSETGWKKID